MVAYADAALLLRRAGFGGTRAEIEALTPLSRADMVNRILDVSTAEPDVRPAFLDDTNLEEWEKGYRLQLWWLDRMRTSTAPLQEKMTWFWHGHFATSMDKVYDARALYDQNATFRAFGLGRVNPLTRAVSLQAALLRYLDNDSNVAGAPNENFARELLELFTLGIDQYTQQDVAEGARAWTGHNVDDNDPRTYRFYADRHDDGDKTIFGITRNWDGPEIIDQVTQVEPMKTVCARFIAKKLWKYLAYSTPSATVLDTVAAAFHDSDLDVTELLRAIFMHDAFYSSDSLRGHFRSPVEWVVAAMRVSGVNATDASPVWWMQDMGQMPLYPPNVAGWSNNGVFISTTADWARMNFARFLTWKWRDQSPTAWSDLKTMGLNGAIDAAYERCQIDRPSAATRSRLLWWLNQQRIASGAPTWEWDEWQVINLFTLMLLTPDFNMA